MFLIHHERKMVIHASKFSEEVNESVEFGYIASKLTIKSERKIPSLDNKYSSKRLLQKGKLVDSFKDIFSVMYLNSAMSSL